MPSALRMRAKPFAAFTFMRLLLSQSVVIMHRGVRRDQMLRRWRPVQRTVLVHYPPAFDRFTGREDDMPNSRRLMLAILAGAVIAAGQPALAQTTLTMSSWVSP